MVALALTLIVSSYGGMGCTDSRHERERTGDPAADGGGDAQADSKLDGGRDAASSPDARPAPEPEPDRGNCPKGFVPSASISLSVSMEPPDEEDAGVDYWSRRRHTSVFTGTVVAHGRGRPGASNQPEGVRHLQIASEGRLLTLLIDRVDSFGAGVEPGAIVTFRHTDTGGGIIDPWVVTAGLWLGDKQVFVFSRHYDLSNMQLGLKVEDDGPVCYRPGRCKAFNFRAIRVTAPTGESARLRAGDSKQVGEYTVFLGQADSGGSPDRSKSGCEDIPWGGTYEMIVSSTNATPESDAGL